MHSEDQADKLRYEILHLTSFCRNNMCWDKSDELIIFSIAWIMVNGDQREYVMSKDSILEGLQFTSENNNRNKDVFFNRRWQG